MRRSWHRKLSSRFLSYLPPLLLPLLLACSTPSPLPLQATQGPAPRLAKPSSSLLPTVNVARAQGFADNQTPRAALGLRVQAFARHLQHPRTLLALPNGDVLVTETDAPQRMDARGGIKNWFAQRVMEKAGSHRGSPNRVVLLRDADGDGVAEARFVLLEHLNSPFGMALVGQHLYIANTDAVMRYPFRPGQTSIAEAGTRVASLPAGKLNHHWTKDMVASADGKRLFVSVGSNSNIGENGMDQEDMRAAILEIELASGNTRVFASGLRNANGLALHPQTGQLWAVVNERDEIGNDLAPDYLTAVLEGRFYGWPWSYWGQHVDKRVQPPRPDMVARAITPDYALGAHVAPLGMAFYQHEAMPAYRHGAFIGMHGSWNRKPKSGYKLVFVPFRDGRPSGLPQDILTGFLDEEENALGRPVGVAVDSRGGVLVADDVGHAVWRVSRAR